MGEGTAERMKAVMDALGAFSAAQAKGPEAAEEIQSHLEAALVAFAVAVDLPVALGTDYRVSLETVTAPDGKQGIKIQAEDMTPEGMAFLAKWTGFMSYMEEKALAQRVAQLEMIAGYFEQKSRDLQTQVDNLTVDVKKLQHKIRG